MNDLHEYAVTVTWTGNKGAGTTGYKEYSRAFELEAEGKHAIAGSSDPAFRGDEGRWNPEQLLVGSLSACHKLWFLHLAAVAGVVVTEYVDHAEGTMRTTPGAETGRFEQVTLRPAVTITADSDATTLTALHEDAHRRCFIANSVNFPVRCEPVTLHEGKTQMELAATHYGR
ncbi:MAG: OsmC family protein [Janthinobacterium lividum]